MSLMNPSAENADVQKVVTTEPVEANVTQEDAPKTDERKYTGTEMELIVKDRLTRERKKFDKEKAEWQSKQQTEPAPESSKDASKVNPNIESEWKAKLSQHEATNRELAAKLAKYRDVTLTTAIEKELLAQGCVDPELVSNDLRSRKLVESDDEGNLIVGELWGGKLEDLVSDYLSKKPHLVKAQQQGGLGTRAPKPTAAVSGDPSTWSIEQLEAQLGIKPSMKPKR